MEQVVWDTGDMLLENTCSHPDPDPNPHDALHFLLLTCTLELKELSFFLTFIILHALFNTPMCVDSENLCMRSPALLKKVRNPSKK